MRKTVDIEVCPRMSNDQYHACLKDNEGKWSAGSSVEEAIVGWMMSHYDEVDLDQETIRMASHSLTDGKLYPRQPRTTLKVLLQRLNDREITLNVIFRGDLTR